MMILIVDDNEAMRGMLEAVLADRGYKVISAGDGEEALSVFETHRQEVRLVISDLEMPRLDGITMCHALRKSKPDLQFVIVSGFIDAKAQARLSEAGLKHVLHKPYTPDQILTTVQHVLSTSSLPGR
jgi:CheY-like chemotaxis protein